MLVYNRYWFFFFLICNNLVLNFSILLFLNSPKKEEDINVLATKNKNKNHGSMDDPSIKL